VVIQLIARNSSFPQNLLHKLNLQIQDKKTNQGHTNYSNTNKSRATFMYYRPKIRKITNLFKHTIVKVAFRNTNTLHLTKPKTDNKSQEQDKSGIYELTRNTCHMSYVGQTSHSLKQRYQEHIRYIKNNEPQSAYTSHILNNKHKYGPIHNTMTLLKHINKTTLIPYEQLYIHSYHHHKQLIPEQHVGDHNPVYQLIYDRHITSRPAKPTDQ
jgi:hypothetical protein